MGGARPIDEQARGLPPCVGDAVGDDEDPVDLSKLVDKTDEGLIPSKKKLVS